MAGFIVLLSNASLSFAHNYPNKPIRLIVPFAPGGSTDIIARAIAEPLSRVLGQEVLVENKAGAGGSIGALDIIKSSKEGYVLGMATVSTTASNPAINKKIGYDPIRDFQAITNIAATPNVLAVHPSFPAKDYKSFIELIKRHPGKYAYSSSGAGGIGHLQTELFKNLSGAVINHVPYRGAGPALVDTVAGKVPIIFDNLPSAIPYIKEGRLIPIVVAAPKRLANLPHVPTFAEVGLTPVNRMAYYGLLGPSGMSKEAVDKIYQGVQKVLKDPAVRKRIADTGSFIVGNTPEQFGAEIKAEFEIYKNLVSAQGLSLY
ncbi:tripartite tricarboxylate transporter substrate binding protein BugE [Polynucleobacter sp. 30F-ANTBAC]|jgi:tripartite-type tricarboxylate transporter receptor subunit TctC|nr:tripartite tricarboxylate transporter substrate binding protein BugE [Polynucleobacter sp. 30F-ANTBAC]MBU3600526.1 tripartite tricarboxylate transporter substrate binding protein BugE [Polynucleobacter sp. 30F-ANTBAC]